MQAFKRMICKNKSLWQLVNFFRKTRQRANIVSIFFYDLLLKKLFVKHVFAKDLHTAYDIYIPKWWFTIQKVTKINLGYWMFLSLKFFGCRQGQKNRSANHFVIHKRSTCNYILVKWRKETTSRLIFLLLFRCLWATILIVFYRTSDQLISE